MLINLSDRNIEREEKDEKVYDRFLGGRGECTKIAWDRIRPETSPLSEDNAMVLGAGLLSGTLAPGANRTVLVTRSPQTNLLTYSNMGGFWGPELKQAGYDNLVITGKSQDPCYLWISNRGVEIRDASHLWGKDIKETQEIIRKETNDHAQTLCIGQAGENRVFCASIEHSSGASFSRSAVAAVMGDKRLKAIAVRGTREISIAKPAEFYERCQAIHKKAERIRTFIDNWSFEREGLILKAVYGNLGEFRPFPNAGATHKAFVDAQRVRQIACWNCTIRCKHGVRLQNGSYSVVKCVPWYSFMACCKIQDLDFGVRCYHLCEKYGFDALSSAYLVAYAIDLYEKGILTRADTGGLHLEYGNPEVAFEMIRKIAFREDIGDVLANGIVEAARQIGRGAEQWAYHVKKLEIPIYPIHHPYLGFVQAVDDRADMLKTISAIPQHYLAKTMQEKKDYTASPYWPYPEEFKELLWKEYDPTFKDYERVVKMVSFDEDSNSMADITGVCIFWTGFFPFNPYLFRDQTDLISFATGRELPEGEGMKVAKRTKAMMRGYNLMLGLKREDDEPPERFFKEPSTPPVLPARDKVLFDQAVDMYYEIRGYDRHGVPKKKTLSDLGLDEVQEALSKRGVKADEEGQDH